MKRMVGFTAGVLVLVVAGVSVGQQPAPPTSPPGQQQMPMQGGMCPMMMGGMMSGGGMMGGMGMMRGQPESPGMMQMRGEMMKAMGDVLIKHGKAMEDAKP